MRLLEQLLDTARYKIDAYRMYGCLPVNKQRVGKGCAVNRSEWQQSVLYGMLNRLERRTKGCSKMDKLLILSIGLAWLRLGWI